MANDNDLIAVWETAVDDLGIEVVSPHVVGNERFPVQVRHFGRPAGTLPIWMEDQRPRRAAEAIGYFVSMLNPEVYFKYDRATLIETLVDWGYFGEPDKAPGWIKVEVARLTG